MIAYRHAGYDTPWWAFPSSREGRFHRATIDTVQYLSLHPLGPAAELLRHHVGPEGDPDEVLLNLWAVDVDMDNTLHITFDDCAAHGISPEDLVGDDYMPTQALADSVRATGLSGIRVPSAALPGTDNLVLFDARVSHPFLAIPLAPAEVPTGHLSDGARPPAEVVPFVRWFGSPHVTLDQWLASGAFDALQDPVPTRW